MNRDTRPETIAAEQRWVLAARNFNPALPGHVSRLLRQTVCITTFSQSKHIDDRACGSARALLTWYFT